MFPFCQSPLKVDSINSEKVKLFQLNFSVLSINQDLKIACACFSKLLFIC